MSGTILPLPQYAFMAWCFVPKKKHRDKFTSLHPELQDEPCCGDWDPLNMELIPTYSQLPSIFGGRLLHP
jgi:hypothetical protein